MRWFILDGMLFFAFQKTRDGNGESYGSEVFFIRSKNFLEKHKAGKLSETKFDTLPYANLKVYKNKNRKKIIKLQLDEA